MFKVRYFYLHPQWLMKKIILHYYKYISFLTKKLRAFASAHAKNSIYFSIKPTFFLFYILTFQNTTN